MECEDVRWAEIFGSGVVGGNKNEKDRGTAGGRDLGRGTRVGHCRVVDVTLFVLIAPAFVENLKPRGRTRHGMGRTLHHVKPRPLPLENADCRSSQPRSRLAASFVGLRVTTFLLSYTDLEPMDSKPKQSKRRENVLSSLNVIIEGLKMAESLSSITPAKAVFSTVSFILTMIRVSFLLRCDDLL